MLHSEYRSAIMCKEGVANMKRVIIDLPEEVVKQAKIHAVKVDKSLREVVTEAIYYIVKREENKNG